MKISTMLKEKRTEYELTQEQLSEKIFVSRKTISNWETGKSTPDIDSLIRLANLFDVSLDNLLLEGSDIVDNIKNQAELKHTNVFLFLTFITNSIFFFLATSQVYIEQLTVPVNIAIFIGSMTNIFAMFYFMNKISKLDTRTKSENKKVVFIVSIFFVLIVSIVLTIYFSLSK